MSDSGLSLHVKYEQGCYVHRLGLPLSPHEVLKERQKFRIDEVGKAFDLAGKIL